MLTIQERVWELARSGEVRSATSCLASPRQCLPTLSDHLPRADREGSDLPSCHYGARSVGDARQSRAPYGAGADRPSTRKIIGTSLSPPPEGLARHARYRLLLKAEGHLCSWVLLAPTQSMPLEAADKEQSLVLGDEAR